MAVCKETSITQTLSESNDIGIITLVWDDYLSIVACEFSSFCTPILDRCFFSQPFYRIYRMLEVQSHARKRAAAIGLPIDMKTCTAVTDKRWTTGEATFLLITTLVEKTSFYIPTLWHCGLRPVITRRARRV